MSPEFVLTKRVNSTFRALWLVHQTPNILCHSPGSLIRFASVSEETLKVNKKGTPLNIKKQQIRCFNVLLFYFIFDDKFSART